MKMAQHEKEVKKIKEFNRLNQIKREIPPVLTEKQKYDYHIKQKGY